MNFAIKVMRYPSIISLYIFFALATFSLLLTAGLVKDFSPALKESGSWAMFLRVIVALPVPFIFGLILGGNWKDPLFLIALGIASYLMISSDQTFTLLPLIFSLLLILRMICENGTIYPILTHSVQSKSKYWMWVLIFILFGCGLRFLSFEEPFERDIVTYGTIARSWLEGLRLYADIWDQKPPSIYLVYAGAIWLFGQSATAIWFLNCAFFSFCLLGVGFVAQQLTNSTKAAIIAMCVWTICGTDPLLQANQPNTEVFMNTFLVWALGMAICQYKNPSSWMYATLSGFLFFIATTFKQIAIFPALFVGLWFILASGIYQNQINSVLKLIFNLGLRQAFQLVGIIAVGWIGIFGYFYVSGTLEDFYYAIFLYNQSYAGSIWRNIIEGLSLQPFPIYIAASILLTATHLLNIRTPLHALMGLFAVACLIMVAAPGKFFPHYFQLLLPLISISTGWILTDKLEGNNIILGLAVLLAPIWISFGYFIPAERLAFVKYGREDHGIESYESKEIGKWIAQNTKPSTRIFHWGMEPGIYFWSGRPSLYKHSYYYPFYVGPEADRLANAFLKQLRCNPPDLVVVNKTQGPHLKGPIWDFLTTYYGPAENLPEYIKFGFGVPKTTLPPCEQNNDKD